MIPNRAGEKERANGNFMENVRGAFLFR